MMSTAGLGVRKVDAGRRTSTQIVSNAGGFWRSSVERSNRNPAPSQSAASLV
jgi:hypothetical protein